MLRSKTTQTVALSGFTLPVLRSTILLATLSLTSIGAQSACLFAPGPGASAGDDIVTCDNSGSDPAGLSTLAGNDSLNLQTGSAINGLVDMGTGLATVTNAGLIDSSQVAISVLGSTTVNNTSTGVINFADEALFGRAGVNVVGQATNAAVDIDNSGRIEGAGVTDALSGIGVSDFTSGLININNNAGAVLSVGEPGISTAIGADNPIAAIIVGNVGTANVTAVNDGTINVNTRMSYTTINTNMYGMTIENATGAIMTNNGVMNIAATLEEHNVFGILSQNGSGTKTTNTGSISVTGTNTYTGVPAVEEPDIAGMVSVNETGDIDLLNTSGATISVIDNSPSSLGIIGGMGVTVCMDGTGCLGSSVTNAGSINVAVNNGTDSVAAGMLAGANFVDMTIANSGTISSTNSAPGSSVVAGIFSLSMSGPNYTNSGSVSAQDVTNSIPASGVIMFGIAEPTLNNTATGTLTATGAISGGMIVAQSGSTAALVGANVTNAGSISGTTGILINGSPAIGANINNYFDNSGSITGSGGVAIDAVTDLGLLDNGMGGTVPTGATIETVENSGIITGGINLGPGDDAVLQTSPAAAITGNIDLGAGEDTGQWSGGSMQDISGNDGSDSLVVSSSNYDGSQILDGGDDTATGDGWTDVLTVQGATITTGSANVSNWETLVLDNSLFRFTDNMLTVGADPGTGLSMTNGGALSLQDGTPADAFSLIGNLNGGGLLLIDTALGDSGSATDTLGISGDASGVTILTVANAGGLGSPTTGDGILIVQVAGSSATGAFVLAGSELRAGDYVYDLVQVGEDWYLQSVFEEAPEEALQSIPTMTSYSLILLAMLLGVAGATVVRVRAPQP